MPRITYGDDVKARAKRLFAVLLSLSDLNEDNCGIDFRWDDSGSPKLVVKTTLRHLEALAKKDGQGYLSKTQIREALQRMEDFLGILADNRLHKRGTENWDFTLTLWFRESAKNLDRFEIEWDDRRPEKSKQQAAATTQKAKTTQQRKSSFCQAPALPQYFVERPSHQEAVKNLLLSQAADTPGTLVVSAIYGLGGIGKSTLAAALAHSLEVQTCFPDGILWVTLGQNPDLLPLLGNWIQRLEDYNYKPVTITDASMHLQTLLYDKKALLVVDDAWNPEHVEPFRVGGSKCRVLITTREAVIKGATRYDLDVLTPDESLELLQKTCASLNQDEQQLAQELAVTVGYLPLALDLAAAQIAEGVTFAELLEDLKADIAYLETLDLPGLEKYSSEEKRKHCSLIASFNLSLRSLTPEMLRQFAWFGVLPEDVNITPAMAATLWEITPRQALTTLRTFKTKALLLPGTAVGEHSLTYRLHDLMHDMAKRLLTYNTEDDDLPGLGLTIAEAHALLLKSYKAKTQSGLWHTLLDDGYIHAHLSWHFKQANQINALHQLLTEETESGLSGWYQAREKLGQFAGYLTDIFRAWELANTTNTEHFSPKRIGLQCFYALIVTSLNSLAEKIPSELLLELVKKKVWTPEQALAYAKQIPQPRKKTWTLKDLIVHLSGFQKEQALEEAWKASLQVDGRCRLSLAPQIPEHLLYERAKIILATNNTLNYNELKYLILHISTRLLEKIVEEILAIDDKQDFALVLVEAAPHLPAKSLKKAFNAALEIENPSFRANALIALVPYLPQALPEAFKAALAIENNHTVQTDALIALVPHLPEALPEAFNAALEIENPSFRANALIALVPYLPQALLEAFKAALAIENNHTVQTDALIALVPHLPEALPEALNAALAPKHKWRFSDIGKIEKIVPYLPASLLDKALKATVVINDEETRQRILGYLAPFLTTSLLEEAFKAVLKFNDEKHLAIALRDLAPHLPSSLLSQALDVTLKINHASLRRQALCPLAPRLPAPLLEEAFNKVLEIEFVLSRAMSLYDLSPYIPAALFEAFNADLSDIIAIFEYEFEGCDWLIFLVSQFSIPLLKAAYRYLVENGNSLRTVKEKILENLLLQLPETLVGKVIENIPLENTKVVSWDINIVNLVPYLPSKLLPKALKAVLKIEDVDFRAKVLISLVPFQADTLQHEALKAALALEKPYYRVDALGALAPYLSEPLLQEALTAIVTIEDAYSRATAIIALATYLPTSLLQKTFQASLAIEDPYYRAKVLIALVPRLPPALPEALNATLEINDAYSHATAIITLVPYLTRLLLPTVLKAALAIEYTPARAHALSVIAIYLPEALPEALKAVLAIEDADYRAKILSILAPHLPISSLVEILKTSLANKSAYSRAKTLHTLVPYLPEELLPQVFEVVLTIENVYHRAKVLSVLAPHLPKAVPKVFEATLTITNISERVDILITLAPYIAEALTEAFKAALAIKNVSARVDILIALVPHLPEAVSEAFVLIQLLERSSERAKILSILAPYLPEILLPEALKFAQAIENTSDRADALRTLVLQLSKLPTDKLLPLWQDFILWSSHRNRQNLMQDIAVMAPVIYRLGGQEAITEVAYATQAIGRWWS